MDPVPDRKRVLMREPADSLGRAYLRYRDHTQVDVALARQQWVTLAAVFEENGWRVERLETVNDLPDCVFVDDAVGVFGDVAVISRLRHPSRRDEVKAVERAVRDLGHTVRRIVEPGTLEGGDILRVGATVYAGLGSETNSDGIRQLAAIIEPLGYNVVTIPVAATTHLQSVVRPLPDGATIGFPPAMEYPELFDEFLEALEPSGAAVIPLDGETLLIASSAPLTARLLEDKGFRVIPVDISEFEKVEGCIACLAVRV
jgi:dimethylargininase